MKENLNDRYDVVVIGGGAAGISGAIALARSRRSVLVVDAGEPRNAPAAGVHNFLTRDGLPPAEIYALGRAELGGYGGHVIDGRVTALASGTAAAGDDPLFRVEYTGLSEGAVRSVAARRLLIATGLRDELPDIPGLAARWGIDVLHCPYCHGWEVRDQRVGILATSPMAAHQALLFRQLTPHVTVLRHAGGQFAAEQLEQFAAVGIEVAEGEVEAVEASDGRLAGVRLAGGRRVALDALVVAPVMRAAAELAESLCLRAEEVVMGGQVIGSQIPADPTGATKVPGVWVAGNAAAVQAQVVSSAAAGVMAGAAINMDLVAADARRAVAARRAR